MTTVRLDTLIVFEQIWFVLIGFAPVKSECMIEAQARRPAIERTEVG